MKNLKALYIFIFFAAFSCSSLAQVTVTNPTNTTPNLAATYTSLANAITALNAITSISGPVIITLNAGNPQTAPAGGYTIQFSAVTSAVNNITITGNNNIITASNAHTAGSRVDAIFKLVGVDFITLRNFVMQENAANTTTSAVTNNMTEWGVALLYASSTNGAQNNTIRNNTISLNKAYGSTFGIYSNTNHTLAAPTSSAPVTATSGTNSNNKIYVNSISNVNMGICFIGCQDVNFMDTGNDIGGTSAATGNTITNWGGLIQTTSYSSSTGSCYGINSDNQKDENISFNTITSAAVSGASVTMRGIFKDFNNTPTGTFSSTIGNNTITISNNFTSGTMELIRSQGIASPLSTSTINITSNTLLNNVIGGASASINFVGITNSSQCGILNINSNVIRGTTSTATTGGFTGITNTGAITTTLNMNSNQIGNSTGAAITFSAATSGIINGITCPTVGATAAVSISNNNFQGFNQTVAGSGTHNYISLTHAASGATTDNINNNTFTNITANTTGTVTFIARSGAMALNAGATENCNNNSIVTGYSKPAAGGNLRLYVGTGAAQSGNTQVQTGNNFSNITVTGATVVTGWINGEGSASAAPVKTFENNTFSNWNCGFGVTVVNINNGGTGTSISNNIISNISATDAINGMALGNGFFGSLLTIAGNSVTGLTSTGGSVTGITGASSNVTITNFNDNIIGDIVSDAAGVTVGVTMTVTGTANYFRNKVYDISGTNAGSQVYGMQIGIPATVTATIFNNLIGDIKAPNASIDDAVNGLRLTVANITSTYNVYYNTIYLAATSTAANFGSTAFRCIASGTATSGNLTLRNNIIINNSTANGTGLTVAYKRSNTALANFNAASNNNIFYAGTPSASNLIFYDGTNADQTLTDYKARVSTRDAASFTELCSFVSLVGTNAGFLHLNPLVPTQAESGAVNISGFTTDYDINIRQGNTGYTGTGTAPDIGADELEGIPTELNPPVITYTVISSPNCSFSNITITGVNITDATGVPLSGANRPRIYYKRNSGSWFSQPGTNTAGTATNSTWSFTIVASDMGTLSGGDIISYYIIAQDIVTTPNVGSNPSAGLVATNVNSVTTAPTSPNTYTLNYNLSGTYTVGAGGNFTTLTAAVAAYNNACALTGAVVFELIDNNYPSETYPIAINNHADASAVNTLTIRPSATAVPVFTNTTNTVAINLNGAKFIRFDGRQGGIGSGRFLTLTNSGGGITLQFINDAQNNIVRNCIVKGQRVSAFSGTIFFSTAGAGSGNDNNTIDNNEINEAGGFSNNAIYSAGTALQGNDNITISNNLISNYFNATNDCHGIFINTTNAATGWVISNNRFFQTATRLFTGGVNVYGIRIATGSGYTINNNTIGFADANGNGLMNLVGNSVNLTGFPTSYTVTGTPTLVRFLGIACDFTLVGSTSSINGNTVGGISVYSSASSSSTFGQFCGIYIENGPVNIGNTSGNIIGSSTSKTSVYLVTGHAFSNGLAIGIRVVSTGSSLVQNNIVGGILVSGNANNKQVNFTGISLGGLCNYTASNNQIGNSVPENIQLGYATTAGSLSNTGTLEATTGFVTACSGLLLTSTGNANSISQNQLQGWVLSAGSTSVMGISTSGSMTGIAPSLSIINNAIGTAVAGWVRYKVVNSANLNAIYSLNTNASTCSITGNDVRGITYESTSNNTGYTNLIYSSSASNAGGLSITSNNTFTNLNLQSFTFFIESGAAMGSGSTRIVSNNQTVGNTSISNGFSAIDMIASSTAGSVLQVTDNNFSNISFNNTLNVLFSGQSALYNDRDGNNVAGNHPAKKIAGNIFTNISGTGGILDVMSLSKFGNAVATDSVTRNQISNISLADGILTGIALGKLATSGSNEISVYNNILNNLSVTGTAAEVYGIHVTNTGTSVISNIQKNDIHGLVANGASVKAGGIVVSNVATKVHVKGNKIYDVEATGSSAAAQGINIGYDIGMGAGVDEVFVYNNLIGEIRTPSSGNAAAPSVEGISIREGTTLNVINNSVYLTASSSDPAFSSAALYSNVVSNTVIYNNILCNLSAPGASGKTVAHWREDNNVSNLTANNNDLYAGAASSTRLVYFDGTNSSQTLAAYQTAIAPYETKAVNELPVFIGTTAANADYLHIDPLLNCSLAKRGNNQLSAITDDYDGDARMSVSPWVVDIGADEASKLNIWTGAVNSNWSNAGNWSEGIVPNAIDQNVLISNPPATQPLIATGETFQVGTLVVEPGATLNNRGTIQVNGVIAATAGINNIQAGIVEGSVEMNGNCNAAQNVAGSVFAANSVKNFTVSNSLTVSGLTGEQLNIHGTVAFNGTGKTLNTGDNIILASTVNATANVADVTGNSISGKVTVERYINTGVGGGRHPKTWQFLATPAKGQTIFDAWQEGGATPAGYGTILTGTGTGFDITTALPSMKYFDPTVGASGNWVGISNTSAQLSDQRGYMVFVRGDRTVNTLASAPNPTNLRSKGTLYQPSDPPPVTNVLAGKPAAVGNPYASAIDLEYLKGNGLMVNLNNDAVVWDPLLFGSYGLGGYQTLSAANNYEPTAGGTAFYPTGVAAPHIQSGQAFFVQSAGPAGSISFTEAAKVSASRLVNRNGNRPADKQFFRARLFTNSGMIADGNAAVFSTDYRDRVDADDAVKIPNSGENFFIQRNSKQLSVESRSRIQRTDTIFYQLNNLRKQPYRFRFEPLHMNDGRLEAILIDQYLQTQTAISLYDSTLVNFTVNNEPASAATDRFYVVFRKRNRQPLLITEISAHRNDDLTKKVIWKVANESMVEQYSIERSLNGYSFENIATETGVTNNEVFALYRFTDKDKNDQDVYYRIKAIQTDGQIIYSETAVIKSNKTTVGIYPNPVVGNIIRLRISGMPAGSYQCSIVNQAAQEILQTEIQVTEIGSNYPIALKTDLPAGTYFLRLSHPSIKTQTLKFTLNK